MIRISLISIGLSGQTEHNGAIMTAFINNLWLSPYSHVEKVLLNGNHYRSLLLIAAHSLFTLHMSSSCSLHALPDQETVIKRKAKCRMTSASISPQALEGLFIYPLFHSHTFITHYTAAPETSEQTTTLNGIQTSQAECKLICLTRVKT